MESNYFEYDREVFARVSGVYEQSERDLEELKKKLDASLEMIKADWQSGAGDTFFEKYSTDFTPIFQQYMGLLTFLKSSVDDAIIRFDPVVDEAKKITF